MRRYWRSYFMSLAVLLVLSAYPLINGVRIAYISITRGSLEPEQYAQYVVPYAAICVSILWYAALQPVFAKIKRFAFPVGIFSAYGVFIAMERYFESMQIRTVGMAPIDTSTLEPVASGGEATADIWQFALCYISPDIQQQSPVYSSQSNPLYVAGNNMYKIHYYLISLILITMVCGLVYGLAKVIRNNDREQIIPLCLRGVTTATLTALCIFANTTAFFRQAEPIQTPLASVLTGLFFIILGAAAGIYTGSFLLKKERKIGIGMPLLISLCVTALMYFGEAAMMGWKLYRFGTGWFFNGLPGIILAPVDIIIVLLAGVVTWFVLKVMRKRESKFDIQTHTA